MMSNIFGHATYVVDKAYNVTVDAVGSAVKQVAGIPEIAWLDNEDPPKAPDGLYDVEAAPTSDHVPPRHSWAMRTCDRLIERAHKGLPVKMDWETASALVNAVKDTNWTGIDDRKFLMEKLIVFSSKLRTGSRLSRAMNNMIVGFLYDDLPHPPVTFVGPAYMYRSADGSNNNVDRPLLGAAGQPYARSVAPSHPLPPSQLPDPGLVFDALLRREGSTEHPAGISSLLFSFATLIIHNLFRTSQVPGNRHINDTSSYLDLSPLYGHDQEAQNTVRKRDGRGKLHEDVYAENRLHMLPPSVSALLILFCRNHNYIAEKLLQINERRMWSGPDDNELDELDKNQRRLQDDEIFNTARLVNCGFFMNIILTDYLSAILGLVREGSDWFLDPLQFVRTPEHELLERGTGNACSVEFNLLYRWHATISIEDTKWTEDLFEKELFPGQDPDSISFTAFGQRIRELNNAPVEPKDWPGVPGLKRNTDTGRYENDDLARVLQDATENAAQAFKARGTPSVMRLVEIMGIKEARDWGVCSMNEFRRFLGLKAYKSFEEWNPSQEIANAARRLYGHIDKLELYPGLMAEEPKPSKEPGVGLCPGYTISRGILSDAVALTRGDRHFTTDFTPHALTAFGYQDCSRQTDNGSFGGTLGRLLFRHLPNHYHEKDVYAHFPMMTPTAMESNLDKLGVKNEYNFQRPKKTPTVKAVNSYQAVRRVLNDSHRYKTTYSANMKALTNGYGFFLAEDNKFRHDPDRNLIFDGLFSHPNSYTRMERYFFDKTVCLIREKSYSLSRGSAGVTQCVDIVRDVINLTPVHWVSDFLSGLPVKTDTERGLTDQEAYKIYMVLFQFIFLDVAPEYAWFLRRKALEASALLLEEIERHLEGAKYSAFHPLMWRDKFKHLMLNEDMNSHTFCQQLLAGGRDRNISELAYNVLGVSVASAANYAQAAAQVINLYLDDKYAAEREEVIAISSKHFPNPEDMKRLQGYVREAMRLDPQAPGIFRQVAIEGSITDCERDLHAHKGDILFVSLAKANMDPYIFPNPERIDPSRPEDSYMFFGDGMHKCLGKDFVIKTMPEALRAIFRLKNVRRGPGDSGKLNRFIQDLHGTKQNMYLDANGMPTPWPVSMVIQYDE